MAKKPASAAFGGGVHHCQLRDTAGSGGVILGATKLFLPVFCRTDHSAPFKHP